MYRPMNNLMLLTFSFEVSFFESLDDNIETLTNLQIGVQYVLITLLPSYTFSQIRRVSLCDGYISFL